MQDKQNDTWSPDYNGHDLPLPQTVIGMRHNGTSIRDGANSVTVAIDEARKGALSHIILMMQATIEKYQGPHVQCRSQWEPGSKREGKQATCDAIVLGTLLKGASSIGIWPPPNSTYTNLSWRDTSMKIRNMKITALCEEWVDRQYRNAKYANMELRHLSRWKCMH
jgi:hypothetical protein